MRVRTIFISFILLLYSSCGKIAGGVDHKQYAGKISIDTQPQRLRIHGDFDGDGKADVLQSFLADSLGRPVVTIPKFKDDTWEDVVAFYGRHGYYTAIALIANRRIP